MDNARTVGMNKNMAASLREVGHSHQLVEGEGDPVLVEVEAGQGIHLDSSLAVQEHLSQLQEDEGGMGREVRNKRDRTLLGGIDEVRE